MNYGVIDGLVRPANPVPDPRMLEPVDVSVLQHERREEMQTREPIQVDSVEESSRRGWLIGAAAALVVVIGAVVLFQLTDDSEVTSQTPATIASANVPVEQMATIRQLVDAINARDAEAFIGAFATEGLFDARGAFVESSWRVGRAQPVTQVDLVQAWMAIIHAWGLEADLLACSLQDASSVRCDVATRWASLSLELTEVWIYEFRGTQLEVWGFDLLDLNPDERTLPLGYDGIEAWEAWLEANDPLSADRYLNPRVRPSEDNCLDDSCAEFEAALAPNDPELAARLGRLLWEAEEKWSIDGHEFAPLGLIPYDPALADEIEASILEYLETR